MANNPDGIDQWSRDFTWDNGRAVRFDKWGTPREVQVTGPNGSPVTLTQSMYYAAQGNVVEAPNSGARGYSPSMPTNPANPVAGYTQNADGSFSKPGTEQDPAKQSGFLV